MSNVNRISKKRRLARIGRISDAPRWADIRKFGLKRARTRRIRVDKIKKWRRSRLKL
ncbi:MAG: hypothetical protein HY515_02110 [Candidatus Aenigmarchaeota archaeon]|nr:hypothetical protein [Candidatus Aenigmarchaeota archaeon]